MNLQSVILLLKPRGFTKTYCADIKIRKKKKKKLFEMAFQTHRLLMAVLYNIYLQFTSGW